MQLLNQTHLTWKDTINLGGYYTPPKFVDILYQLLRKNVNALGSWTVLDTSSGYGVLLEQEFLPNSRYIGGDIDPQAISKARKLNSQANFYVRNGLHEVDRTSYNVGGKDPLIIVGNPPYNDKTSIIRNNTKDVKFKIDTDLRARDLGLSFLLSYNKLAADYVCVLHPLSYLIKEANFKSLKEFKNNYLLLDAVVFSSAEFSMTSKITAFPIVIALYKRNLQGMDYEFIANYNFHTIEGKTFRLNDFDYVKNYINKYPNKKHCSKNQAFSLFWTMRDINALKRSRTFIEKDSYNAIYVPKDKMPYYCYVDVFKKWINAIPYYFGNCDIFIDNSAFLETQEVFKMISLSHNSILRKRFSSFAGGLNKQSQRESEIIVEKYFRELLGEHYVY